MSAELVHLPLAPPGEPPARFRRRRAMDLECAASMSAAELLALATGAPGEVCRLLIGDDPSLTRLPGEGADALARRTGLTRAQATRLIAVSLAARRLAGAVAQPGWRVRSPADVGERMLPTMRHLEQEELRTLLLNTKNVVGAVRTVYVGNLAGSAVRVGEVFRDAVRRQAAALVVVHNHPSGDPTPSADDLRITAELAQAGRLLDIELLDHIVIGADRWVSLRAMGAT